MPFYAFGSRNKKAGYYSKVINRLLALRLLALNIYFEFVLAGFALIRQILHFGVFLDRE